MSRGDVTPEKRKVGGSTPPLPTTPDQPEGPEAKIARGLLTTMLTTTASLEAVVT